jgi:outer membrane lipoprotein carrier protein
MMATLATLALLVTAAPPAPADPGALLDALTARFRGAASVKGHFTQTYTNRALGRDMKEEGTLLVAPPDRLRWEYVKPERKLFVAAGGLSWFYVPADEVAYRVFLDKERSRLLPGRFILGDEKLSDEFEATEVPAPEGLRRLVLMPRVPTEDLERLVVTLAFPGPRLDVLEVLDPLGNRTTYRFSDLAPAGPPRTSEFEFDPPRGVDVVDEGSRTP